MKRCAPKPRPCDNPDCRTEFTPQRFGQVACSPLCAIVVSAIRKERKEQRQRKTAMRVARKEKREGLEKLKSQKDWLRETQPAFNAFIRERDFFLPCISCGAIILTIEHGGAWDAGHYRTIGAAPELRFEPLNVHKQCKSCNSGVRRQGARVVRAHDPERAMSIRASYRVNLIERIGLAKVEWLEGPHEPKRYTVAALQEIARDSRARTRELRAQREQRAVA